MIICVILKSKSEAKDEVSILIDVVSKTNEKYKSKDLVNVIIGKENALIKSHKTDAQPFFGTGKHKTDKFWMALIRQVLVAGLLRKDIETYGVLKVTDAGKAFLSTPESFMMTEDHAFDEVNDDSIITAAKGGGAVADENLMKMLKDLRKHNAKKLGVPPFVIFQDPSLEDMSLKYPITLEELSNVHGVGEGKAKKYGRDFVELIADYVEENDITRVEDMVRKIYRIQIRTLKLYIITKH